MALPPGLQNHPIRALLAPPDRRLTLSLTVLCVSLLGIGVVYLSILGRSLGAQPLQGSFKTVQLLLDEGGDGQRPGAVAPMGGGKDQAQVDQPSHEPESASNALETRVDPAEESMDALVPLKDLADRHQELLALQPSLLTPTAPGRGGGLGSGLGGSVGNGMGRGMGTGTGLTWIHSAHGDEQLKVAVSYLDVKDYIAPEYPTSAWEKGISGDVVLSVTISVEGRPIRWSVVEGHPLLVAATLKVFHKWRFIPVIHNGERVAATFEVRIRFTLM